MDVYQLTTTQTIEYEWDKGPRPAGYANLKLRLEPDKEYTVRVITPSRKIWTERITEYYAEKLEPAPLAQSIESFMPAVFKGVRDGVKDALATTLNRPVTNVIVVLEEVRVDPVYSTEMSFHFAAKSAIRELLTRAKKEGALQKGVS